MFALVAACLGAQAQTVYRCTDAGGKTAYRDAPCNAAGGSERQTVVRLPANPPPAVAASAPAKSRPLYVPPARASVTLYYDSTDEPIEYPTAQVEAVIREAMTAWMAGCQVDLVYGGKAPYQPSGTAERVSIRWRRDYMQVNFHGGGLAGTGSMRTGIELTTRLASLRSTFVHELGHVLGLGHTHEQADSVMSYLRDETTRQKAQPSQDDYLACNLSMKKMFGIDFKPPADVPAKLQGSRMSDEEAVRKSRELYEKRFQEEQKRYNSGGR